MGRFAERAAREALEDEEAADRKVRGLPEADLTEEQRRRALDDYAKEHPASEWDK